MQLLQDDRIILYGIITTFSICRSTFWNALSDITDPKVAIWIALTERKPTVRHRITVQIMGRLDGSKTGSWYLKVLSKCASNDLRRNSIRRYDLPKVLMSFEQCFKTIYVVRDVPPVRAGFEDEFSLNTGL